MPKGSKPGERRGGRKKGTPNKITADVKALAQKYCADAIKGLAAIAQDDKAAHAARVAAWREILDRAVGKAAQHIEQPGGNGAPARVIQVITLDA